MNIVFLNIYNGLRSRGAERTTHELASRLAKKHKVTLIQGGSIQQSVKYQVSKIPVLFPSWEDTSFHIFRKLYLDPWSLQIFLFTLLAIPVLLFGNFDIVIPVNGGWQSLLCRILTWFMRTKLLVIGRAGIGRDDKWNLMLRPDAFVALTNFAKTWAITYAKGVKVVYIPNGVDTDHFHPGTKKAEVKLEHPIILCAAAFTPQKRIEATIDAVSAMNRGSLLLLGDGPWKNAIQRRCMEKLGLRRFFMRSISHEEMPGYYEAADVFTLVSDSGEAFGNVYLEAMAHNKAVVATDDQTRHEIIGEAGIYVDPIDIQTYTKALEKALRYDFGDIPRKQAMKFSWNRIQGEYEKVFESL